MRRRCDHAHALKLPLEFSERSKNSEHPLARCRRGTDSRPLTSEHFQTDATPGEIMDDIHQNAVIIWNTVYMAKAIDPLKKEGYPVCDSDRPVSLQH